MRMELSMMKSIFNSPPFGAGCFFNTPTRSRSLAFVGVSHRGNAFPQFQRLRHFVKILCVISIKKCVPAQFFSFKNICEI